MAPSIALPRTIPHTPSAVSTSSSRRILRSPSRVELPLGIDGDRRSSSRKVVDLVDVFMRKFRVKIDVKECMKQFSRCGGQRAVECGDDPPGGLATFSARQLAHGGVIPHFSSSELSAHQMPARMTSAKGTSPCWRRSSLYKNYASHLRQRPGKDECEAT